MFAQSSAASAAATSATAPPLSAWRKPRTGEARLRVQAVPPGGDGAQAAAGARGCRGRVRHRAGTSIASRGTRARDVATSAPFHRQDVFQHADVATDGHIRARTARRAGRSRCSAARRCSAPSRAAAPAAIPTAAPAVKKGDKAGHLRRADREERQARPAAAVALPLPLRPDQEGPPQGALPPQDHPGDGAGQDLVHHPVRPAAQEGQVARPGLPHAPRLGARAAPRAASCSVKRLRRVWLLGPCASLPSIETLGTPVTRDRCSTTAR